MEAPARGEAKTGFCLASLKAFLKRARWPFADGQRGLVEDPLSTDQAGRGTAAVLNLYGESLNEYATMTVEIISNI